MPYRKLYRQRQELSTDYQPRSWYVEDALKLSWVAGVELWATDTMPVEGLRGFIVRKPGDSQGLRHHYTIVVAEGMPEAMERFVCIKELMHCYFRCDDGSATDSQIVLDNHLRQFFGQSARSQSLHVQAEYTALWMAMGVLCPEARRQEYAKRLKADRSSLPALAAKLKAPPHIVRRFFSAQYEDEIAAILN